MPSESLAYSGCLARNVAMSVLSSRRTLYTCRVSNTAVIFCVSSARVGGLLGGTEQAVATRAIATGTRRMRIMGKGDDKGLSLPVYVEQASVGQQVDHVPHLHAVHGGAT